MWRSFLNISSCRPAICSLLALTVAASAGGGWTAPATGDGRAAIRLPDVDGELPLAFADEFDDFGPAGVWRTAFYPSNEPKPDNRTLRSNAEQQLYVDAQYAGAGSTPLGLNPFAVEDGVLTIAASPTPQSARAALWNYPYVSGLITSLGGYTQLYGYFEVRARLPAGPGLWPAFWLLQPHKWPPEIDVMEALGDDTGRVYMSYHTIATGKHEAKTFPSPVSDTSRTFHTYGVLWSPRTLRWYIDRRLAAQAPTPPDLDQPMHMLVNLAVGGTWPGLPTAETTFPARMDIDYVRTYALPPGGG